MPERAATLRSRGPGSLGCVGTCAQHALRGDDESDVRMIGPEDLVPFVCVVVAFRIIDLSNTNAGGTSAASLVIDRRAAVQGARDFLRKQFLPDAFFTGEQ